jgi:hypothetical protein
MFVPRFVQIRLFQTTATKKKDGKVPDQQTGTNKLEWKDKISANKKKKKKRSGGPGDGKRR